MRKIEMQRSFFSKAAEPGLSVGSGFERQFRGGQAKVSRKKMTQADVAGLIPGPIPFEAETGGAFLFIRGEMGEVFLGSGWRPGGDCAPYMDFPGLERGDV